MIFSFARPTDQQIRAFLKSQRPQEISSPSPGKLLVETPPGFRRHSLSRRLGAGEEVFQQARSALRTWQQLQLRWVETWPREPVLAPGTDLAVVARAGGLWWMNACRLVHVDDDAAADEGEGGKISSYTYATLPGHVACGEEQFLVRIDDEGQVWYEIIAVSRPQHPLAWLGLPILRGFQRRFGQHSAARMQDLAAGNSA